MNRFHHQRLPLIILVCGTACVGKSTLATQLAQRLNLPNVLQVSSFHWNLHHHLSEDFTLYLLDVKFTGFPVLISATGFNLTDRHGLRVTSHLHRVITHSIDRLVASHSFVLPPSVLSPPC
jgi:2-phosphoglycerate kinase